MPRNIKDEAVYSLKLKGVKLTERVDIWSYILAEYLSENPNDNLEQICLKNLRKSE